jgi:hypothetical protein
VRPAPSRSPTCAGGIGALGGCVGATVTVAGVVTEVRPGEVVLEDGTGQIRVGGSAAAEALSPLRPGDAIEVAGVLTQDEAGPLLEADPASLVVLSAAELLPPATDLPSFATASPESSTTRAVPATPAAAVSARRASPTAPLPDTLPLTAFAALIVAGVAFGLAAIRHRGTGRRPSGAALNTDGDGSAAAPDAVSSVVQPPSPS